MSKSDKLSFTMMTLYFIGFSGIISEIASGPLRYIWIAISVIASGISLLLMLIPRPCGHGVISKGWLTYVPWVVDPCPVCGDTIN